MKQEKTRLIFYVNFTLPLDIEVSNFETRGDFPQRYNWLYTNADILVMTSLHETKSSYT